jgi:outer membrane lipoprotein-sorting protein
MTLRLLLTTALVGVSLLADTWRDASAQAPPAPPRRPADMAPSATPPSAGQTGAGAPTQLMPESVRRQLEQQGGAARPPGAPTPGAAPAAGQPAPGSALTELQAVERVNAYLNSFRTLVGDFVQFGADGRRYTGKLYVHRPGRMRFEYNPPATIEVISDGTTVAVRDKKLATQDNYLIGQTPLKFLLKETIDLQKDVKILRTVVSPDAIRVTIEDRATLGGTSRITLNYDPRANVLRQWIIVDPQGYETNVQVANLSTTQRPDPALFRINLERIIAPN